ncbi:hypothetical protein AB0C07_24725 [Actinoplanes missouriensis]|uniref:hypothetical protein n=1 Tax=Actinoplanes missouriensis TaxID=1866 RepID=UPI0033D3B3EB
MTEHGVHGLDRWAYATGDHGDVVEELVAVALGQDLGFAAVTFADLGLVLLDLFGAGGVPAHAAGQERAQVLAEADVLGVAELAFVAGQEQIEIPAGVQRDVDHVAEGGDVVLGGVHPDVEVGEGLTGAAAQERVAGGRGLPVLVLQDSALLDDEGADVGHQ